MMRDEDGHLIPTTANRRQTNIQLVGFSESVVRVSRARLFLAALMISLCFVVLGGRMVYLSVSGDPDLPRVTKARGAAESNGERAAIVDRNGVLLAGNLVSASLFANPQVIDDPKDVAARLVKIMPDLNAKKVRSQLASKRAFVWLKRNLTPREQQAVNDLGVPGLSFKISETRVYPHGRLLSHILGFTDIDNHGIAGVEQYFDQELKDRARSGRPLQLSLDAWVQHALLGELQRAMKKYRALGAAGVVMDVRSGEVVAMASLPDFDPNNPSASPRRNQFNRATKGVYELGSVFKTFTVAMALDSGTVSITGGYDATQPIKISRHTIRDFHAKKRWLSVPEIFMYSSNIGAAKMAIDVGGIRQQDFMSRLGLLSRSTVELPEVGDPLLPNRWRDIHTMTIAFGHGISVSPVQLASGMAAMVNGGVHVPATLLKRDQDAPIRGDRVVSKQTSDHIRGLLRLVVHKGTGSKAQVKGYVVGGKTGTAEKAGRRGYREKALLTSFVAAFPMDRPRYVVYALLDEPKGIKETQELASAGWNAAPTAGRIIARIAPLLGVRPVLLEEEPTDGKVRTASVGGKRL